MTEIISYTDDYLQIEGLGGFEEDDLDQLYNNTLNTTRFNIEELQNEDPRFLTDDEIEEIVNEIPTMVSLDQDTSNVVMKSIRDFITVLIKQPGMEIVPSAIEPLKKELIHKYRQSKMAAGSMVGLYAAQAIGAQLMQATLNTFHKSGSKKNVASGFKAYDQLLKLTKNPSFPSCSIYFKDHPTYEDIIRHKRAALMYTTIENVMSTYDILSYNDLVADKTDMGKMTEKWYYSYYLLNKQNFIDWNKFEDMKKELKDSRYYLRITLNVHMLYEHKITVSDVSNILHVVGNEQVISISSPYLRNENNVLVAYVDVYPRISKAEEVLKGKKTIIFDVKDKHTEISQIYINTIILPMLGVIKIKGIDNIVEVYPEEYSIWDVVKSENRSKKNANEYVLTLDQFKMRKSGVTKEHIIRLWGEVLNHFNSKNSMDDIKQFESDNNVLITLPKKPSDSEIKKVLSNVSILQWNPTSIINYITNKEIEDQIEYKKTQNKIKNNLMIAGDTEAVKRIRTVLPKSKFQKALYLVFAVTEGSNLESIFELHDVDSDYTISNIPSEIVKCFGIEAAHQFITKELYDIIIRNDNYINPRHCMLISDHMTYAGYLMRISETGMKYQPMGTMARAGFRKAKEKLVPAFLEGRSENVTSINTSIMLGKKIRTGTGLPSAIINRNRTRQYIDKLKESGITSDEFEDQFKESNRETEIYNDDTYESNDVYVAEDAEGGMQASGALEDIRTEIRYTAEQTGGIRVGASQIYGRDTVPEQKEKANENRIEKFPKVFSPFPAMDIKYLDKLIEI